MNMQTSIRFVKHIAALAFLLIVVLISLYTLFFVYIGGEDVNELTQRVWCKDDSAFHKSVGLISAKKSGHALLNHDGTIKYLYDDFSSYKASSTIITDFESTDKVEVFGSVKKLVMKGVRIKGGMRRYIDIVQDFGYDDFHINGNQSLRIVVPKTDEISEVTVRHTLNQPLNLLDWEDRGVFSLWLHVPDKTSVNSISLRFVDGDGNVRTFNSIRNLQLGIPNFYDRDDAYPDIPYRNQTSIADEWTDYQIVNGWNFVFWRNEYSFFQNDIHFNITDVRRVEIRISLNPRNSDTPIFIDDLRFSSGFQKKDNVLAPNWYPPHGRPQYGIFELGSDIKGASNVKLINVRQAQYPSNGDHARMITRGGTPESFFMRVRFKTEDMGNAGNFENTWFRVAYDFDPQWDPGHDWFGFYSSIEWSRMGLITVMPIERFYFQDQEPKKDSEGNMDASVFYAMQNETTYEVQMKVNKQLANVWVYTVGDNCLKLQKKISYTFKRNRHQSKRYPIAVEVTGNMKVRIYEIEIAEQTP